MTSQGVIVVVLTSGPPGYLLKVCNCGQIRGLMSILYSKTHGFCQITLFLPKKSTRKIVQNICVLQQIRFGGVWGSNAVQIFQKPSFYLSATLVFSKGCSPGGRQPSTNLRFFNISPFGFFKFVFSVLKRVWFSGPLFWATSLSFVI